MVYGWRRAFCISIPRDKGPKLKTENQYPKSKFGFFSNPSMPRLQSELISSPTLRCRTTAATNPTSSIPNSPKLQCKAPTPKKSNSSRLFHIRTIRFLIGLYDRFCTSNTVVIQGYRSPQVFPAPAATKTKPRAPIDPLSCHLTRFETSTSFNGVMDGEIEDDSASHFLKSATLLARITLADNLCSQVKRLPAVFGSGSSVTKEWPRW